MRKKKKNKIKSMALVIVALVGLILVIASQTDSMKQHKYGEGVSLSIGCSLIATVISTLILSLGNDDKTTESFLLALKEVGIDIDVYRRHNMAMSFPSEIEYNEIEKNIQNYLKTYKINRSFSVGHYRPTRLKYYYDLIGGTCNPKTAEFFAKILCSYWRRSSKDINKIRRPEFNFVVTPKGGSPILGYEFAKCVNRPFVLHEETKRLQDNDDDDMRTWFDCSTIPEKGETALIVDDSTTGGTMVLETVKHLRQYGYCVNTCLVIFSPAVKDAQTRLEEQNVQLVSITVTHND